MTVGGDSAQAPLEAAAWQEGHGVRLGTFAQTVAGWAALRDAVAAQRRPTAGTGPVTDRDGEPVAIVLEPTGGDELALALWARQQHGWQGHRPNPARVRAWGRSQGWRAKTDRQDARRLVRFGAMAQPALSVCQPLASEVSEVEQRLPRRADVAAWRPRERRRSDHRAGRPAAAPTVRASLERLLTTLADERAALEQVIAEQVPRHAAVRAGEQRVRTGPGVGPRVGLPFLVVGERSHALTGGHGNAKGGASVGLCGPLWAGTPSRMKAAPASGAQR